MTRCLAAFGGRALRACLLVLTALSLTLFLGLCALLPERETVSRELECVCPRDGGGGRVFGAYAFDSRIYLGVVEGRRGACALEPGLLVDADPGWARSMMYRGLMHRPGGGGAGFGRADVADVDERIGGEILGWTGVRVRGVAVPLGFAIILTGVAPGAWCAAWCRRRGWLRMRDCHGHGTAEDAAAQGGPAALIAYDAPRVHFRAGRWLPAVQASRQP